MLLTDNLIKVRKSKIDKVAKYIFKYGDRNVEAVYVDNETGKDIVCIPSQTGCKMLCKFCHLTARADDMVQQLEAHFTVNMVKKILVHEGNSDENKTLLISFMGSGEPLLNVPYIISVANSIRASEITADYDNVRFAAATIMPKTNFMVDLMKNVLLHKLPLKVHWSLHHPEDEFRSKVMPKAANIRDSANVLKSYRDMTGNPVEVHYTLFEGNDDMETCNKLADLLLHYNFPIKFLEFSERPDKALQRSEKVQAFTDALTAKGVSVELYTPPGHDVLSACGEFETT